VPFSSELQNEDVQLSPKFDDDGIVLVVVAI
jgi:hypothetical protein